MGYFPKKLAKFGVLWLAMDSLSTQAMRFAGLPAVSKIMQSIEHLLDNNRVWASAVREGDPRFFSKLADQQNPEYLWIGCSDSRVPANQITGLAPGEVFVHRNVANVVAETDFNLLAVLQYAVDVLKVRHIIVCGHYGCGGVRAALENFRHGIIDNWLSGIRALRRMHRRELDALDPAAATDRLCELNVLAQARHVAHTTILQDAWERGQHLTVHSWIYRLDNGIITPLAPPIHQALEISDPENFHAVDEIPDSP
jgi:carbonic anhydrase